jgi:hypothetical protein
MERAVGHLALKAAAAARVPRLSAPTPFPMVPRLVPGEGPARHAAYV